MKLKCNEQNAKLFLQTHMLKRRIMQFCIISPISTTFPRKTLWKKSSQLRQQGGVVKVKTSLWREAGHQDAINHVPANHWQNSWGRRWEWVCMQRVNQILILMCVHDSDSNIGVRGECAPVLFSFYVKRQRMWCHARKHSETLILKWLRKLKPIVVTGLQLSTHITSKGSLHGLIKPFTSSSRILCDYFWLLWQL